MPYSSNLDELNRHLSQAVLALGRMNAEPRWDRITLDCLGALLKEALHIVPKLDPEPARQPGE